MNIEIIHEETDQNFIVTANYGDISVVAKCSKLEYMDYVNNIPSESNHQPIDPIPYLEEHVKRELVNYFNNKKF